MTICIPAGIVDTPADSLFSYQPGENWATYYDPFYMPSYETVFDDPALEAQARNACGDDKMCLFDVAATGNIDIGMSTLNTGKEIERIATLTSPESGLICYSTIANNSYKWSFYMQLLFAILPVSMVYVFQTTLASVLLVILELFAMNKVYPHTIHVYIV